jgi:hypothetical protein
VLLDGTRSEPIGTSFNTLLNPRSRVPPLNGGLSRKQTRKGKKHERSQDRNTTDVLKINEWMSYLKKKKLTLALIVLPVKAASIGVVTVLAE